MSVILRQGLCAWMVLVEAQQDVVDICARTDSPFRDPPSPPPMVPRELLAAWTDLVIVVASRRPEVHP